MTRVYLSPPHVFGQEERLVADAFASNWIAPLGPHVDAFEAELAATAGAAHAVALSSGTAALHLALKILGVASGDEVICSSLTFSASANPIAYLGGVPVFVDCDESWTIDPNRLEDALRDAERRGRRPKALIVVDLYGQCADYEAIGALCAWYGVPILEDAAEALGSTYRGRPAGSFGQMGVFSFNGNKIITTSGGGMLVSDDEAVIRQARHLATQARDPAPHYQHSVIGYNYRLSNVLAAIGRGQLATLTARVAARRRVFDRYVAGLGTLAGVTFMPEARDVVGNRWLTCVTIDPVKFGATREDVRLALEAENIESRPVWKPMHLQPVFAGARMYGGTVSQRLFADGLCLPSGSNLSEEEQDRVIAVARRVARAVAR
ncbi:MAG: DegT/DnrJ/EryC1/StrS family aminotransferase [Vicinamibacterales bacterium]